MDFKREFTYEDTYLVWETIWASSHVVSSHFYLFVALALVETYRDIILGISYNNDYKKKINKRIVFYAFSIVLLTNHLDFRSSNGFHRYHQVFQ